MNPRAAIPPLHPVLRALTCLLVLAALPLCAAAPVSFLQGGDIPLRGTATGSDVVYLFLTGPNLPDGGINLAGGTPVVTGEPGSFTKVVVSTDGTWAYTWQTGDLGRVLDPGSYVVFIAEEPRARPDLDGTVYATWPVNFGTTGIMVTATLPQVTETAPGTMQGEPPVPGMETVPSPVPVAGTPPMPTRSGISPVLSLVASLPVLWYFRRP